MLSLVLSVAWYLFCVAQIFNLPYRRIGFCVGGERNARAGTFDALPTSSRRYGRLQVRATRHRTRNTCVACRDRPVASSIQKTFFKHDLILKLLLACSLVWLTACERSFSSSNQQRPAAESTVSARRVKGFRIAALPLERTVSAVGSLAAFDRATLSTKVAGRLQTIAVDIGSVVRFGETIAQIEPRDYQLQVQQSEALLAQARVRLGLPLDGTNDITDFEQTSTVRQMRALLDEAKANRERVLKLTQQGILSTSELETTEAAYKVALSRYEDALVEVRNRQALLAQRRAELEIARQHLTDTVISAPFDGAVQERRANLGEFLDAGTPLVTLVRMNPLRLRLEVPEREATNVRVGQKVRLKVEGSANVHTGEIKRLSPVIEEPTLMLRVEADVANPGGLRPGSFVRAEIVTDDRAVGILVPAGAITSFAGVEKAFVIREGKALEKLVTTGRRIGESLEILAGLEAGDVVVIEPGDLQTGQTVNLTDS
ncbi:MAG: efflux RND transporter periplasmic adaptor subunit [Verrucomicrobia bacterium]|nr:efflux RND transporter periplasmic adaptor subunit [Verrucomicrobiota bacterium]